MRKTKIWSIVIMFLLISFHTYEAHQYNQLSTAHPETFQFGFYNNVYFERTYNNYLDQIFGIKKIYVEDVNIPAKIPGHSYRRAGEIITPPKWMQFIGLQKPIYLSWNNGGHYSIDGKEIKNSPLLQIIIITLLRSSLGLFIISLSVFLWRKKG